MQDQQRPIRMLDVVIDTTEALKTTVRKQLYTPTRPVPPFSSMTTRKGSEKGEGTWG